MNNRNLLIAVIGLFVASSAFAGMAHSPIITQVIKHVIPYDTYVWDDNSSEVVVLVRVNETGHVQELGVESTTGTVIARSKLETVRLLQIEPFLFEGREIVCSFGYTGETKES